MRHSHRVTFDSHGKGCNVPISFGAMPARLPTHQGKELHFVVIKGFGRDPMMLLTLLLNKRAFTKRAFTRFGGWVRTIVAPAMEKPGNEIVQPLPGFAELFDMDGGWVRPRCK